MCDVQRLLDDLGETFNKFKELRRVEMINLLSRVRCCECGHRLRLSRAEAAAKRCPSRTRRLLTACFVLLLLIAAYWVYLARQYNHASAFGSGACVSTFFYTFTDCDVYV